MSGQRIDYHIERQRHERFVGRSALLDRLDQLLITDPIDRWVVVTGGPGMGKSAILAAWLARREAAGGCVPHHFIRRGEYDWDDPAKLVGSVVAQIEARFPDHRGDAADAEAHPGARLMSALMRVSVNELRPRGERMVVLIDGLDEYDPPSRFASGDPLSAFLPHALPPGVCFLCATRPRHPYMALLASRDGELVRIDLDDPDSAADNEATVRAFWEATATPLQLDMGLVDELVARARGNLQHAVTLRKYLAGVSKDQRNADAIPRGLDALLVKLWARIATDPLVMRGLGVLCAAREALTLEELGTVEGWSEATQREAFLCGARELLVETRRADAQPEYRLHHDAIRAHITSAIGTAALRGHHAALARHLARWPAPSDPSLHRYALRHALSHRWEAEQWEQVWRLAGDMSFLEARYRALGSHEVEADIARAADRCRARGEHAIAGRLQDLLRALIRESHWLRTSPGATAGLVWNRLRRSGWSMADLDERLQIPPDAKHLRLQLAKTRESPSLIRDLIGHSGAIYACSMTVDGRYVLSASGDHTVKEWDLESGRAVATFEGHAGIVKACAVTPDGRRMVSASDDSTLKVWDLANRKVLRTLTGHTDKVNACAVTCDGRYVVSASDDQTLKAWELESGRIMATFEGHTGCVVSCTVTPDGQRAVSASFDRTLKVWDIRTGRVLVTCVGHTGWVTACTVTRDGRQIISASEDHDLRLWNLDTGQSLATYAGHTDGASACVVTPDGRHVISASWDRTLKVWDLETGVMVASLHGHGDWVTACIVTPDGKRVVSASHDRTLKVWSLGPSSATLAYGGNSSTSTACAVTSDGRRVVAVTHDGKLNVWDAEHGVKISELKTHVDSVTACVVMPDDRRLLIGSSDGMLGVLDLTEGRLLEMWRGHAGRVTACALTPDGRHVVSGSVDQTLKLWDVNQGHALTIFHARMVTACVVTPDGRHAVSASKGLTVSVWDLDHRRRLLTFEDHDGTVTACAVTRDGRRVISASRDRTLKVWALADGQVFATLEGHTRTLTGCAVTHDGRYAISASQDRTLRVWDLESYACVLTHYGDAPYTSVAITAGGIVTTNMTGSLEFLKWPASMSTIVPGEENSEHQSTSPKMQIRESRLNSRHVILFLAANPQGTTRLALDEECAAIERELSMSSARDDFDFRSRWAVGVDELMRHLNELRPTVIHFSGHCGAGMSGNGRGPDTASRNVQWETATGIQLQDEQRRPQHVGARALSRIVQSTAPSTRVVLLNACYSSSMADALRPVVDCVVGMTGAIGDDAARTFAVGFYRALGYRRSVGNAVAQAVASLAAKQFPDEHLPVCCTRQGIDAEQLFLPDLGPSCGR